MKLSLTCLHSLITFITAFPPPGQLHPPISLLLDQLHNRRSTETLECKRPLCAYMVLVLWQYLLSYKSCPIIFNRGILWVCQFWIIRKDQRLCFFFLHPTSSGVFWSFCTLVYRWLLLSRSSLQPSAFFPGGLSVWSIKSIALQSCFNTMLTTLKEYFTVKWPFVCQLLTPCCLKFGKKLE